jgi:YggT family protein
MTRSAGFLAHWYYHVPDLVLAALIWLLIARLLVWPLAGAAGTNVAFRVLRSLTDPVLAGVGAVTPRLVPPALVILCAAAWLLAARIMLFLVVSATGVRLSMG